MRVFTTILLTALLGGLIVSPGLAQVKSGADQSEASRDAARALEEKGLRKQSTTYVLVGESELSKLSRARICNRSSGP